MFEPLISNHSQLPYVWYADKPIALGGVPEKISIERLNEIVGNGFQFEETIRGSEKLQQEIRQSYIKSVDDMQGTVLAWLENPMPVIDKLVICDMGPVGLGVFARETISAGTVVACYTGQLGEEASDIFRPYANNLDCFNGGCNYYVDAENSGGIARFFQHLPVNLDEQIEDVWNLFDCPLDEISKSADLYMMMDGGIDDALKREQTIKNFHEACRREGRKSMTEGLRGSAADKPNFSFYLWGIDDLEMFGSLNRSTIASETLFRGSASINHIPVVFFWNFRQIEVGEQLGFSYGFKYWLGQDQALELFTRSGSIIPRSQYRYKKVPVSIPIFGQIQRECVCFFSRRQYDQQQIDEQSPVHVQINSRSLPVSFFQVRKRLAKYGVIDPRHDEIESNSFVISLKRLLPAGVIAESYYRYPDESIVIESAHIVDVVCRASTDRGWEQLVELVEPSVINKYCRYWQSTKEIVIRDVNSPENVVAMHNFIQKF